MSSEMNGSKTQIIVAVIALIGVIGGAVITNWDKLFNQNQGSAPKPTPVNVAPSPDPATSNDLPTPSPEVNISGVWRDNTLGTTSQVTQQGGAFKFTAWGTACVGGNFQSSGDGTIREIAWKAIINPIFLREPVRGQFLLTGGRTHRIVWPAGA
jgi:hypothetical protein